MAKNNKNGLRAQAKVINNTALAIGEDLVNIALKNGEVSKKVFATVLKGGITIFGMQQELALTVLEKVAKNVKKDERLNKVVNQSMTYYKSAKETALKNPAFIAATEMAEKVEGGVTTIINKLKETKESLDFEKEVKSALATADEIADKVEEGLNEIKETASEAITETVETVKATANEVIEETVETVEETKEAVAETFKSDLKKINGVGPKTAEVLSNAGFDTFEKLANATEEEIKAALEAAGNKYKKFNPTPWIEEAKGLI